MRKRREKEKKKKRIEAKNVGQNREEYNEQRKNALWLEWTPAKKMEKWGPSYFSCGKDVIGLNSSPLVIHA